VVPHRLSPSNSAGNAPHHHIRSPLQENDQDENFLPTDRGGPIAEESKTPDDPDDSEPDDDNDETGSQKELSLARSLALLSTC
jgi:hypothetical protein